MSLDVAYSYCVNLTEEEKIEIDKQVRKNRFELKFVIVCPFFPFSLQQMVRNAKDRAELPVKEKLRPLAETVDDYSEAYNKYIDRLYREDFDRGYFQNFEE